MFVDDYKHFHKPIDGFINSCCNHTNMHWNKNNGRFSKTSEERNGGLPVAHDARTESVRHGLEAIAQRWTV